MVSSAPDLTSRVLRQERTIVAGSIALLVALCLWFLAAGAGMGEMGGGMGPGMDMAAMGQPTLAALILMWWLMMVAMMLPSAAPAILLYARVRAQRRATATIVGPWIFALGYLSVWLAFSIAAAVAQRLAAGPDMKLMHAGAASALLIAAGIYQLSPWKGACLSQCRSPAQFLSRHWRQGAYGAVRLGVLHGAYCLGCCWLLMALLFVGGVMNWVWIVALTLIVAVEKLVPRGDLVGRAAGLALIAWGVARLAL